MELPKRIKKSVKYLVGKGRDPITVRAILGQTKNRQWKWAAEDYAKTLISKNLKKKGKKSRGKSPQTPTSSRRKSKHKPKRSQKNSQERSTMPKKYSVAMSVVKSLFVELGVSTALDWDHAKCVEKIASITKLVMDDTKLDDEKAQKALKSILEAIETKTAIEVRDDSPAEEKASGDASEGKELTKAEKKAAKKAAKKAKEAKPEPPAEMTKAEKKAAKKAAKAAAKAEDSKPDKGKGKKDKPAKDDGKPVAKSGRMTRQVAAYQAILEALNTKKDTTRDKLAKGADAIYEKTSGKSNIPESLTNVNRAIIAAIEFGLIELGDTKDDIVTIDQT